MENQNLTREESLAKIQKAIKSIRMAMLTTADPDNVLRSRPMATIESEFDGTVYFFTSAKSGKIHSIENDQHVNLAYSNPDDQIYVSAAGNAQVSNDREKIKELWSPEMKAWFPDGENDPDIRLLAVEIESAEIWDAPPSTVVHLAGLAKAAVTGKPYQEGKKPERVNLTH